MSQWRQTKHGFACWQSYDPSCSISSLLWSVNMAIVLAVNCCCMGCKCYQLIWTKLSLDLLPGIPAWNQVIFRECNWICVVPKCNVQRATLNSFRITKSWSNKKLLILTLRSCIKGGLYLDGEVRSRRGPIISRFYTAFASSNKIFVTYTHYQGRQVFQIHGY